MRYLFVLSITIFLCCNNEPLEPSQAQPMKCYFWMGHGGPEEISCEDLGVDLDCVDSVSCVLVDEQGDTLCIGRDCCDGNSRCIVLTLMATGVDIIRIECPPKWEIK